MGPGEVGRGATAIDIEQLEKLDRSGYTVREAISHEGRPGQRQGSHATPHRFICIDGRSYWVKGNAQQGLVAELICGRLAAKLNVGPMAQIIRVTAAVLPADGSAAHLEGIVVGSEDLADSVNARDIGAIVAGGTFTATGLNAASRAAVVAFQTWVGLGDSQVLIRLTDGRSVSIDHGEAFGALALGDPAIIVTSIPGVSSNVGKQRDAVMAAVDRIERVEDRELLQVLAQVPMGGPWLSPAPRRLSIAEYLAHRRGKLRGVMEAWLNS